MGKTVPNQKTIKVHKEPCDNTCKENYYAKINIAAMENAAQKLDAGAFKLWCYFAKNQNDYEFALSSKAVEEYFGMKIKQYNNAVNELIDKNFLVITKGNNYVFNEIPVITKEDNVVITKGNNDVMTKSNNVLLPNVIRNITNTTINTTNNITDAAISLLQSESSLIENQEGEELGSIENPIPVEKEWLIERHNYIRALNNGVFIYDNKFYKVK